MRIHPTITTHLWFNNEAEAAARFYASIFRDADIGDITYYGKAGQDIHHMPEGSVMTVEFTLEGQPFIALNGGPVFTFNEAVSFMVNCDNQQEIDYYWEKLQQDGDPSAQQCGWLKDKFGVSWQVAPTVLRQMLKDRDREKAERVMAAMLQMKKIDIAILEEVYSGEMLTVV